MPFDLEKINKIKNQIDRCLSNGSTPIAAFDADGTLWDFDLGEYFFKYQIQAELLPKLPAKPYEQYLSIKEENPADAFLWLAQINAGQKIETVRGWAHDAFKALPKVPVFSHMQDIVRFLQERKVEIYIVTASITWAVEPGAEFLGIPADHVVGVQSKVLNGLVTVDPDGPVSWREGKVTALLERTDRKTPFLAAGNTMGDLALLDCATDIRIVNTAAPEGHENFATEQKLFEIAKKRGWYC